MVVEVSHIAIFLRCLQRSSRRSRRQPRRRRQPRIPEINATSRALTSPGRKLQRSSGALFSLDIAKTEPWNSVWGPPAKDPLREWPDQFFDIDRDAWANDPLGQWGGVPSYTLNYAFMNLFDVIPCGAEAGGEPRYEVKNDNDMTARKRNFYAALSYIHTYPPYEPYDDMESRIGVSSFTFSRQVLRARTLQHECSRLLHGHEPSFLGLQPHGGLPGARPLERRRLPDGGVRVEQQVCAEAPLSDSVNTHSTSSQAPRRHSHVEA